MSFVLADPKRIYKVPVTIPVPADGAEPEEAQITCHFRLLAADEMQPLIDAGDDLPVLSSILAGWEGIQTHDGGSLPFNASNLERLSRIGYWKLAVIDAYMDWSAALPLKNSRRPPAAGTAGGRGQTS